MLEEILPLVQDCIGALDGTHIAAFVAEVLQATYHNCKGQVSQNVLAITSMNMLFLYVLSGWEGSTSDSQVFEDTHATDFTIPPGQYYLADAGYRLSDAVLVPY